MVVWTLGAWRINPELGDHSSRHHTFVFQQLHPVADLTQLIFEPYSLIRHREQIFSPLKATLFGTCRRWIVKLMTKNQ